MDHEWPDPARARARHMMGPLLMMPSTRCLTTKAASAKAKGKAHAMKVIKTKTVKSPEGSKSPKISKDKSPMNSKDKKNSKYKKNNTDKKNGKDKSCKMAEPSWTTDMWRAFAASPAFKAPDPPGFTALPTLGSPLTVGSACCGWGAEIFALERLRVPFDHTWAADLKPCVKSLNMWRHDPTFWFDDVCDDHFFDNAPPVQLFCCGFPCQPFSTAGKGLAFGDHRGIVVFHLLNYIEKHKPVMVVLENVGGLVFRHTKEFEYILEMLAGIKEPGCKESAYVVEWKILNLNVHGGVPQNRARVFIAMVRRSHMKYPLRWPSEAHSSHIIMHPWLLSISHQPCTVSDSPPPLLLIYAAVFHLHPLSPVTDTHCLQGCCHAV